MRFLQFLLVSLNLDLFTIDIIKNVLKLLLYFNFGLFFQFVPFFHRKEIPFILPIFFQGKRDSDRKIVFEWVFFFLSCFYFYFSFIFCLHLLCFCIFFHLKSPFLKLLFFYSVLNLLLRKALIIFSLHYFIFQIF